MQKLLAPGSFYGNPLSSSGEVTGGEPLTALHSMMVSGHWTRYNLFRTLPRFASKPPPLLPSNPQLLLDTGEWCWGGFGNDLCGETTYSRFDLGVLLEVIILICQWLL